ncbi:MAG: hypothetical protein LC790_13895 [Actinobacteria bacterium]|nr:hypothetical protein [Actinomycetota bacterium]
MLHPVRRDLAAVNEAIRYARGVLPVTPAPELGGAFFARFELGLHHVPADLFYAALAVNDDLPWGLVRRYRDEERSDQYFSVALELPHARLLLFTEHELLSEEPDHG